MQINMDVDGVVADTIPYLFSLLKSEGLFDLKPIDDPHWRTWDVLGNLSPQAKKATLDYWANEQFWLNLPVVPFAQEKIDLMRIAGHHINWITAPWKSCRSWFEARREWLHKHFKHPDQDLEKDYHATGNKTPVWADVYIDDKPASVEAWREKWCNPYIKYERAFLFETNFNHNEQKDFSSFDWNNVPEFLVTPNG